MSFLNQVLPNPVIRYLRDTIGVPEPRDKSLDYVDTLVVLQVPRKEFGRFGFDLSLQYLKELVRSLYDNCEAILRCEMYRYGWVNEDYVVHLNIRFDSESSAQNLTLDDIPLQTWLEHGELRGWWKCALYQQGYELVAGFDRGRSGRTVLEPDRRPWVLERKKGPYSEDPLAKMQAALKAEYEENERKALARAQKRGQIAGSSKATGPSEAKVVSEAAGSLGATHTKAGEDSIGLEAMSEVRKGKQRMP
ncbi:MAG: hypothetical protein Q9201_004236 [Fulgogasparrea decipioides]